MSDFQEMMTTRHDNLEYWLKQQEFDTSEQRHLDQGTEARAYWHHGYYMALKDVLKLLGRGERHDH